MTVDTRMIRDEELLDRLADARGRILGEIRKVIVGQDEVIEQVLISLFVGGHTIITGVPGLANKVLIVGQSQGGAGLDAVNAGYGGPLRRDEPLRHRPEHLGRYALFERLAQDVQWAS